MIVKKPSQIPPEMTEAAKSESSIRRLYRSITSRPIYLIIFSFHIPISTFSVYSAYYDKYNIVPAVFVFLLISGTLYIILKHLLRNQDIAGLATLTLLLIFFPTALVVAPVYPLFGLVGIFLLTKRSWSHREKLTRDVLRLPKNFTSIANVAAVMMLLAIGGHAGFAAFQITREADAITNALSPEIEAGSIARAQTPLPHIIHVVLDGYSRADILRSTYGFDNTPFLDALKKRGFRVSDQATAPFNQTLFVMSSIFSLGRVTEVLKTPLNEQNQAILRRALAHTQQHGAVPNLLEKMGYTLVSTPSAYLPLNWKNITSPNGKLNATSRLQLTGTYIFAYDLLMKSPILKGVASFGLKSTYSAESVDFEMLRNVSHRRFKTANDQPLFVYQHILAPHPPFNITANGERRSSSELSAGLSDGTHLHQGNLRRRDLYRAGYVEKLRYINSAILEQIDGLMNTLNGPLIIILHGDHGGGLNFDQDSRAATCVGERFSPLLAVFATDERISSGVTDDFNIINIYRLIFRNLLGADMPNLTNQSTFVSWNLDSSVDLSPGELGQSCTGPAAPVIAEQPAANTEPSAVSR